MSDDRRFGWTLDDIKTFSRSTPPKRVLDSSKVFCPTGPGGGRDATCKPGGKGSGSGTIKDKNGAEYKIDHSTRVDEEGNTRHKYDISTPDWNADKFGPNVGKVELNRAGDTAMHVHVNPEFQRRGIATAAYEHIEAHLQLKLKENWATTEDGAAFWASRNKPKEPEQSRLLSPQVILGGPTVPQDKFIDYLKKHGQEYEAQPLPKGIKKGVMKQCYMNATKLAISKPDLTYVEGIAYTPKLPGMMAVAHAWVVDKAGKVIDNTWSDPHESQYFGVPVPTTRLEMWMLKTKVYGIFGGADKASRDLILGGEKP